VLEAIDALPLRYRLPLVLRYFHELDYEGIADVLNLSRGQVGTLLFRAKRRLRQELSGGSP
jgi:RNA polymerase sigma-70 factor (ECF subfamily)